MNPKLMFGALFHLVMTVIMVWMIYDLRQHGASINSAGSLAAQILVAILAYFSLMSAVGLATLSFCAKALKSSNA